uniref:Cyclin-H n=1 Tax=Plectus sambesii TaxID=2011161 RepID=A0A914W898_9BILA
MWPGVRWSAFAYFKRFYVRHSSMEYSPKSVMMGCFYLAAKIEEFNVSIDDFIRNLRSGTPESNTETILSLEPVIMLKLDYHLTVHSPFRPMEGHLIDMKNSDCCANDVDLECVRPGAEKFYQKGLVTDVMLLFPPAQIALAAVRHGLLLAGKPATIVDDYVHSKLLPEDATSANKLIARLDEIIECVERQGQIQPQETTDRLQTRMQQWNKLQIALEQRTKMRVSGPGGGGLAGDEANNSDDDD